MYPNASGPHDLRTSGPHQRPTHPAYAQPRVTGPHPGSGPHRVTGPQQAVPARGTGPHQSPPRRPAPPAKQAGPKLVAAAVALAVLGGVGGWLAYDAPAENQFQTVSYAGDNPFTTPVGQDRPDVKPVAARGAQRADTPQMYDQDPDTPACDASSLVEQLQADPAKAAAWASVQRTTPAKLPAFVSSLTPVVLRANTAVVDHGYRDGDYVPTPAVLAAGTAVFINSFGQPTVKCFSGDPLTPGESDDPAVTTVTAAAAPITTNIFNDITTNASISIPGKPDSTGTGPSTGNGGGRGDKGGDDEGGGGTTAPAITGAYNPNGTISLSDGRLRLASGEILPAIPLPEGAKRNPDGGWTTTDGKVFNRDGGERTAIRLGDRMISPEGKWTDLQGKPLPEVPGEFLVSNPDGTWTFVKNNPDGTFNTIDFGPNDACENCGFGFGNGKPGQYDPTVRGIRVPPDGKVQNVDLTPRPEKVEIPGVGSVGPDSTNTPPKETFRAEDPAAGAPVNVDQNVVADKDGKQETTIDPATGKPIDPATGKPIDPATGKPIDPATAQTIDPVTGKPIDPATGKPIEDAPVKKAPAAGTNTGVDPVVVDPVPAEKVPGNTGVIVPPVDEPPVKQAPVTSGGDISGGSTGSSSGSSSGGSAGSSPGESTGSSSGSSSGTSGGEGGNG